MKTRVLFVCLGNICRSPLGEGIFRDLVERAGQSDQFHIDSAGTGGWHVGAPPDPRSVAVAEKNDVSLAGQAARKARFEDFLEFDLILAMDRSNREDLLDLGPPNARHKVHLMREFDPQGGDDVPDPYYGGARGFDDVFQMVHRCCVALLAHVNREHLE